MALGVFSPPGEPPRVGARRGEEVLDLAAAASAGPLRALLAAPSLNPLMAAGPEAWAAAAAIEDAPAHALAAVELHLPFAVADYVDFYSSLHHATNAGRIFRPGAEPLPPNWRHLPVGYHGRAGTVVASGTPVVRPHGQLGPGEFGPTRRLDIELELGFVIGTPSRRGEPVPVERALDHVFGVVLLNDWSARDIQALGDRAARPVPGQVVRDLDQPLGRPARRPAAHARASRRTRRRSPYLREEPWAFDVALEVELNGTVVARTNADELYWSAPSRSPT